MKAHLATILFLLCFSTVLQAAKVRITGVDKENKRIYEDQLEPRLQFISARPATSWRADDAAFYLKRILIRRGYAKAEVNWKISGNTIILNVKSGHRYFYGTVRSRQTTILDQETLTNYFYQPLVDGELVSINNAPYIQEYTQKGATNVENYLKSKAYWNASATVVRESKDPATGRINVVLDIKQGPRHTLNRPKFSGISSETEQAIVSQFADLIGHRSSTERIVKITNDVTNHFRRTGYHFAKISSSTVHKNGKTTLIFDIKPGKRYVVRDVIVRGNSETEVRRIKRHFKDIRNQVYDADKTDKATNKLLNSGIFKKVTVTPLPQDNGELDLDVEIEEGLSVTTSAYIGTDSYEGMILGISYSDLNLAGKMWQLSARGEYTGRGVLGEVGITEPFFAGENISFNVRGFALQRSPDGYDKYEIGGEAAWTWSPKDYYSMRAYLGSSFVSTSSTSMTDAELGPKDYLNTNIGLIQNLDLRDNPILPRHGYNGQLLTEIGTVVGDAETAYFKVDINNSYRHDFNEKNYIITRFDTGLIVPANSRDLPIDRRFFSGGTNSVRSFDERGMGPLSSAGDPLGGEAYWVGSAEYVRKVKGPLHLSLFYDLGQVYGEYEELSFSDPSQAVGLSARIHLPIGPIRFEYGKNINRKSGEPSGTFHFTIGASF